MTIQFPADHPFLHYYDSDYPWRDDPDHPENFDAVTEFQGIAHDVPRYLEIAAKEGGPVLEIGAGTGRITVPLARAGFEVTAVDVLAPMLAGLARHLEREPAAVRARIQPVLADATTLDLPSRGFPLAIFGFNGLLMMTEIDTQRRALAAIARHLRPGGLLVVDIVNPLELKLDGDSTPRPFFTRTDLHTGNRYTRFATMGPIDADQVQELSGWYDEIQPGGAIRRRSYSFRWRPMFRFEAELALELAGFAVESVEGGHRGEPFVPQSPHLFFRARRR